MGNKLKVLITEDKMITALDLKNVVEELGLHVTSIAKSGEEALKQIKTAKPDLVLMDILLKGNLTGIETAEKIKRDYDIPIIYITALNDDETFISAALTKPSAIIIKPFTEALMRKAIRKVFGDEVNAAV
jgi:CheY-like chemotaxis protein